MVRGRYFNTLEASCRGIVLLGETGSGKSELAVNLALLLAAKHSVAYFDMDQSKPLFRSRDAGAILEQKGITLRYSQSVMDAPTIPGGVIQTLRDPDIYSVLDVGGGAAGARMMGQFLRDGAFPDLAVLYVINSYRPNGGNTALLRHTMRLVLEGSGAKNARMILNPNKGPATTREDVLQGAARGKAALGELGLVPSALAIREDLYDPAYFAQWDDVLLIRPVISALYGIT